MDTKYPPPHPCPAADYRALTDAWTIRTGHSLARLAMLLHVSERSIRSWRSGEKEVPWVQAELVRRWLVDLG